MQEFFIIAAIHLLAVMSPGADFAVVVRNAIAFGRRAGIWVAAGSSLGTLVHITYSLLGVGLIVVHSPLLFTALKWLGAAYLIYIGLKALKVKSRLDVAAHTADRTAAWPHPALPAFTAFRQGFFADLLNPKPSLFFIALFSQVIRPDTVLGLKVLYGAEMVVATFVWYAFVAVVITHHQVHAKFRRRQHILDRAFGVVMILFGINLAFMPHL